MLEEFAEALEGETKRTRVRFAFHAVVQKILEIIFHFVVAAHNNSARLRCRYKTILLPPVDPAQGQMRVAGGTLSDDNPRSPFQNPFVLIV
jgi:hypothetical protein